MGLGRGPYLPGWRGPGRGRVLYLTGQGEGYRWEKGGEGVPHLSDLVHLRLTPRQTCRTSEIITFPGTAYVTGKIGFRQCLVFSSVHSINECQRMMDLQSEETYGVCK